MFDSIKVILLLSVDLSPVTLAQMRYAVAIAEAGSFRSAATSAAVSQSGLSMQIQKLEELLGLRLFDRSKKPLLVTPEGELAIAQMRRILRETQRLAQVVAEGEQPQGRYRLGVIPTLASTVLPLAVPAFVRRYPRVELIVEELKTPEIIDRLESDTLDAGLAATPLHRSGLEESRVGVERMFAYLAPKDALLRKKTVAQEELAERELWVMPEGHCFGTQVLSYCGVERGRGPLHFESGSFETLIRLVDVGLGATVLPDLVAQRLGAARRKAQLRPFSGPVPVREIGLVSARSQLRRRVRDVLLECLRTQTRGSLGREPKKAELLSPLD